MRGMMRDNAGSTRDAREHAMELYGRSIVVDCHLDSALDDGYIAKMLESGVTAVNLDGGDIDRISEKRELIEGHPEELLGPVTTVREIRRAKEEGRIAVFLGAENAEEVLESTESSPNIGRLPTFRALGLKIIQPCYNNRNVFADGCAEKADGGLSSAGLELVGRMNDLRLIVDCSHVGMRTTLDVCDNAELVVSTHSNSRAVCDNPRNRTDEEIKALAERGAVLGMVAFPTFVRWTDARRPRVGDLLDHVDHIDDLVGVKHVGIGLDLVEGTGILGPVAPGRGLTRWPELYREPDAHGFYRYAEGLESITGLSGLAVGLVERGYSDTEVAGVLGENWLRVFERAWGQ
jgi:membrane dipeptidase